MEGSNQADAFDIENPYIPLETSMRQELGWLSPISSCCIYKVPERLRRVNENAYTPQVVSIGPFHHGKKGLEAMEEHKKRYLQEFLCRTKVSLEDCIRKIRDQEARLRRSYAETSGFSSDEFVRIILVDAAFIIELLLKHNCRTEIKENDRIFNNPMIFQDLVTDMQLLENQLPFFILEDLFYLQEGTLSSDSHTSDDRLSTSVTDLSLKFFTSTMILMNEADQEFILKERLSSTTKVEHFLDLILRSLCQSEVVRLMPLNYLAIPSVTELYQAGVKFKVGSRKNIFDIKFSNGILEIPKIRVNNHTEISLRNLLAFQQCHSMHNHICDYMFIMDGFVNNASDVDLLVERGIIQNALGDRKEVSALFNNLGIGSFGSINFTFAKLCEELNSYCSSKRHKRMANLRHNYFNTPWQTLSVIAAVVLLILTLIQTVCSIISAAKA